MEDLDNRSNYTVISGNKHLRAKIYKFQDYLYVTNLKKESKWYLKCQKTSSDKKACRGTARLDLEANEMTAGQPHNHGPEDYNLEMDLKKDVKRACENNPTNERRSELFRNTVRGHPDATKLSLRYRYLLEALLRKKVKISFFQISGEFALPCGTPSAAKDASVT